MPEKIEDYVKEQWITELMRDHPMADRLMCEAAVEKYIKDPESIDKMIKEPHEKIKRNENYIYNGVTVSDP